MREAGPAPEAFQGTPAAKRRRMRAVDAFIDLVLEGNLPPSVEQVARRAGISKATFFRYFDSLKAMRCDAAARLLERFQLLQIADPGEGRLEERIARFVALRVELWEKVHLMALLQRTAVFQDPEAAEMIDFVRQKMADQIRAHFAPELRGSAPARRDDAVALIATLTSVESWDQFRNVYARSPLQTRRAWGQAIGAVLRDLRAP